VGQRLIAIASAIHGEAALLQPVDDKRSDFLVIFNYEYAHWSNSVSSRNLALKLQTIRVWCDESAPKSMQY
jgi:hypothetical protein